jgi:NAD(P)H-dependent FMN reductase
MMSVKFLAFAASTRREAFSRKVLPTLVAGAQEAGAEVVVADLADFSMPIYQGDEEAEHGMPASAVALLDLLAGCQGLLLVTPEYNGFFPPLLKNTLDWMSRSDPSGQSGLRHFKGKVAGICASSPGAAGGLRSLIVTRQYLGNLGLMVIPEQIAVGNAGQVFDENGQIKDARLQDGVKNVGRRAAEIARRLA